MTDGFIRWMPGKKAFGRIKVRSWRFLTVAGLFAALGGWGVGSGPGVMGVSAVQAAESLNPGGSSASVGGMAVTGSTAANGPGSSTTAGTSLNGVVQPAQPLEGRYWLAIVPTGLPSDWLITLELNGKKAGTWPAGDQTIAEVTSLLVRGDNSARLYFSLPQASGASYYPGLGTGGVTSAVPSMSSPASPATAAGTAGPTGDGASTAAGASATYGPSGAASGTGATAGAAGAGGPGAAGTGNGSTPVLPPAGDLQVVLAPGTLGSDGESITLDIPIFRIERLGRNIPGQPEDLKFSLPAPWQKK